VIALLEHDDGGSADALLAVLATNDAVRIRPIEVPDAPLRLRKIGEAPGRMPGTLAALLRGDFAVAHAFTAQDAVVALAWSRVTGRRVVYTQREPLTRANVAHRRLRLAMLRAAVERAHAVIAPDEDTAESLRRWMAAESRVLRPEAGDEHRLLYSELARS
jgi:hypothetical protein